MIAIDLNTVGNWAERRGIPYTSYMDLTQKPEIRELVREEIAKGNATLPDSTKIRRFLLLTKDLEADDAEMTRTRKVRRRFVAEKYAGIIDAFYSGGDEHPDHLRGRPAGQYPVTGAHRGRGRGSAQPCLISTGSSSRY
jgi:long-chain acyl-CoA synthetase